MPEGMAMTTRGFKQEEARQITHWICDVLDNINDESLIADIAGKVTELCRRFPVYG